jgi:hypothetical protein
MIIFVFVQLKILFFYFFNGENFVLSLTTGQTLSRFYCLKDLAIRSTAKDIEKCVLVHLQEAKLFSRDATIRDRDFPAH